MKDKDIKHLEWVYERMKYVHNENENYDHMIRFREILEALRQPPVKGSLLTDCMYYNLADMAMCQNKNVCINCQKK